MLNTSSLDTDCAHVSLNNTKPVPDTESGIILKIFSVLSDWTCDEQSFQAFIF